MNIQSTMLSVFLLVSVILAFVSGKPPSNPENVAVSDVGSKAVGQGSPVVPSVSFNTLSATKLRKGRQLFGYPGVYGGGFYPGGYGIGGGAASASASASASSGSMGYGGYPGVYGYGK